MLHVVLANIKNKDDFKKKFYPIFSALTLTIAEFLCVYLQIFKSFALLILILNGMYFGFMTSKLILCTMAKKQIEHFTYDNLIYFFSIIICLICQNFWIEIFIMSINCVYISLKYFSFMITITSDLLRYLKIPF